MIRAILDTNIVLDALTERTPFAEDAKQLFRMADNDTFSAFISANTITDIYYVGRKVMSEAQIRSHLSNLICLFCILSIDAIDCQAALESEISDYEDAILASIADKLKIGYIVTRDEKFLKECAITINHADFITMVQSQPDWD